MFGYEEHEIANRVDSWQRLIFKEDLAGVLENFKQHVQSKGDAPFYKEARYRHKNGSTVWVICTGKVIEWNNQGEPIRMVGCHVDITERKRMELELQVSEKRFRTVVSSMDDVVFTLDKEQRHTGLFGRWIEKYGLSPETFIGKTARDVLGEEAASVHESANKRALTGQNVVYEWSTEFKTGVKYFQTLLSPIHDMNGQITGIVGIGRDITENKRMEHELIESENRYHELFELESDSVFCIDNETGRILEANNAAVSMYGYSHEELLEKMNTDLSAEPEKTTKVTQSTPVDEQQIVTIPIRYHRKKDETVFPVEITGRFFNWHGRPVHIAVIRDIGDRMKAEESLRESEKRFRSIIETSQEWIWAIDTFTRHTYCNPAVEKILGYSPAEIIGHEAFQFMHEEDAVKVKVMFPEFIKQKKGWTSLVCRWRHKDGSYRFLESNSTAIFGQNGELTGFWGADRDITERKHAEEERLRLEHQIQQGQKLESLGLLAGGIAHDFNNLMGGIFGYIDLALAASKDRKISGYLSTAMGAIDRARSLTQQLLTFAKGGAPVLEIGSLLPVIRDAAQFALSGSNVSSVLDIAEDLWLCNFDKNQIGQVIDNMVINAQQAMPMGGSILISAENMSLRANEKGTFQAGNYVKISIRDNGIGIPEEIQSRIFDPFFTTKQKGSGLGLSISHSIVKRHKGYIEVRSEPGKGSTFNIYLPAINDTSIISSSKKPPLMHKGIGRILVMDDEEIIRKSLEKILKRMGYAVICKKDGQETLSFFVEEKNSSRSFAAIIVDLTIPGGMGGKETIAEIRKLDKDIPVFVSSGYADDPVMADPVKYGFTDSICKPFTIDELTAMLDSYFKNDQ